MLNKLFKIAHYYAVRAACMDVASLELIVMKVSIALLRFSDIIPVDKAFYEAGIHAKVLISPSFLCILALYIFAIFTFSPTNIAPIRLLIVTVADCNCVRHENLLQ